MINCVKDVIHNVQFMWSLDPQWRREGKGRPEKGKEGSLGAGVQAFLSYTLTTAGSGK